MQGMRAMGAFDYLSVLLSIVLGLSITQLLGGFAAMVRARERIDFYWPLPVQMGALFLLNVQVWWAMFDLRHMPRWSFAGFMIVLLQPVTLYLMTAFITPDLSGEGRFDLRAFYFRERRWFFAAVMGTLLVSLAKNFFVQPGPPDAIDMAGHAVFMTAALCGFFLNSDLAHKILAPVFLLMFSAYIATLFVALPR
jgi:hypothetical protein